MRWQVGGGHGCLPLQYRQVVAAGAPFPYGRSAAEAPKKRILVVGAWKFGGGGGYACAVFISAGEANAAVGSHVAPCQVVASKI